MAVLPLDNSFSPPSDNSPLFEKIAQDIIQQGYSIQPGALSDDLAQALYSCAQQEQDFFDAGIGRSRKYHINEFVRTDEIRWISGRSAPEYAWLQWSSELQQYLNRRLFLGLFSFESHFAHYPVGSYYKRHLDAFKGEANRVLSLVVYLNPQWLADYGGELVLYPPTEPETAVTVTPLFGTVCVFLSEQFPHEVKPTLQDRYSIAGWFRVNDTNPPC